MIRSMSARVLRLAAGALLALALVPGAATAQLNGLVRSYHHTDPALGDVTPPGERFASDPTGPVAVRVDRRASEIHAWPHGPGTSGPHSAGPNTFSGDPASGPTGSGDPGWEQQPGLNDQSEWVRGDATPEEPVPEPTTLALLLMGLGGGALELRRRKLR